MEIRLHDQLDQELAARPGPPLGSIVDDAVRSGVRLRRRRRLAIAGSGATALAVTLMVGLLALNNAGSPTPTGLVGEPATPTTVDPSVPSTEQQKTEPPTTPVTPLAMPPGHRPTTGQAVLVLLRELIGVTTALSEVDYRDNPEGGASGGFVYDDGQGRATVSAGVSSEAINYGETGSGLSCPASGPGFVCEHSFTAQGYELRVLTLGPYTDGCGELKCSMQNVRVEIRRPDGVYVVVDAHNGPFGQGRAATRVSPILDIAALTAIATDPRWALTMDGAFLDQAEQTVRSF